MNREILIGLAVLSLGICEFSEGMKTNSRKNSGRQTVTRTIQHQPISNIKKQNYQKKEVTPESVAKKFLKSIRVSGNKLNLNNQTDLKKIVQVINEANSRSYWRNNGKPGKGSEYESLLARLFLQKIPNPEGNEECQKIRIVLTRLETGKIEENKNLFVEDFDFLKGISEQALNSVAIWKR